MCLLLLAGASQAQQTPYYGQYESWSQMWRTNGAYHGSVRQANLGFQVDTIAAGVSGDYLTATWDGIEGDGFSDAPLQGWGQLSIQIAIEASAADTPRVTLFVSDDDVNWAVYSSADSAFKFVAGSISKYITIPYRQARYYDVEIDNRGQAGDLYPYVQYYYQKVVQYQK